MDSTIRFWYSLGKATLFGCHVIYYNGDEIPFNDITYHGRHINTTYDDTVEVFYCNEKEERKLDIERLKYKGFYLPKDSSAKSKSKYVMDDFEQNPKPDLMPDPNTRWLYRNTDN